MQINDLINQMAEKFGIVIDWTSQNVVPYIQELCSKFISYKMAVSIMWLTILGVILLATLWAVVTCARSYKKEQYRFDHVEKHAFYYDLDRWLCEHPILLAITWVLLFISVFAIFFFIVNLEYMFKLQNFPELAICDYLMMLN